MPRSSEVKKLEANLPADSQNSQIPSAHMHIKEAPLTQTHKREKANKHQKGPKKLPTYKTVQNHMKDPEH
jgi:hypothetical protein